jgi:hypothetical protein
MNENFTILIYSKDTRLKQDMKLKCDEKYFDQFINLDKSKIGDVVLTCRPFIFAKSLEQKTNGLLVDGV